MLVESRSWGYGVPGRRSRSGWRSRPGGEGGHEHLRSRRSVAQRRVRPDRVVVPPPAFDDDFRLLQRVKDFAIEQLVSGGFEICIDGLSIWLMRIAREIG